MTTKQMTTEETSDATVYEAFVIWYDGTHIELNDSSRLEIDNEDRGFFTSISLNKAQLIGMRKFIDSLLEDDNEV